MKEGRFDMAVGVSEAFSNMRGRLSRYRLIGSKIEWLEGRLEASSDPEEAEELQSRINAHRDKSRRIRRDILDRIDQLEDVKQAEVLSLYFVDCQSIEEIAAELSYSERHVRRLYSDAINELIELESSSETT